MTLVDIRDTLLHLGFEMVDENDTRTHFSTPKGKIHVYLFKDGTEVRIKSFANIHMFARNLYDVKRICRPEDLVAIKKIGKGFVFSIKKEGDVEFNEKIHAKEEDLPVEYMFEINTCGNFKYVTLTDYTVSKGESYGEYCISTKQWDGDKIAIHNIMTALMNAKLDINKVEDGFIAVYANGKWKRYE